jgi:hypothetical protein
VGNPLAKSGELPLPDDFGRVELSSE